MTERRWLASVLETFVRAVPRALGDAPAAEGTAVRVAIGDEAGGAWSAVRTGGTWTLAAAEASVPAASVSLDQDTA